MRGAPNRIVLSTAALLLASGGLFFSGLFFGGSLFGGEAGETLRQQALRLTHDNACRRAEAELAEGERFYLVLDPERLTLTLKLGGAPLREVPLDSIEIGRPRRLFFGRDTRNEVRARLHRKGRLAPERPPMRLAVEIPENPDDASQTIMLPPEPETAIAVPRRYFLRYEDGLALEFRTDDGGIGLRQRLADVVSALFGSPELRLRLALDHAAAEAFFRSVPQETDLLVL